MVFKFWFPLNTYKWSQDNEPQLSCFEISAKSEAHHFAPHSLTLDGGRGCVLRPAVSTPAAYKQSCVKLNDVRPADPQHP